MSESFYRCNPKARRVRQGTREGRPQLMRRDRAEDVHAAERVLIAPSRARAGRVWVEAPGPARRPGWSRKAEEQLKRAKREGWV